MAMNTVINTNMMALTSHRNLAAVGNRQNKANQRLSSGKKINSAADDAAGLAITEKMRAQIKGLDMASKNTEDATSLIQIAEGSLTEVNNMLTRIRELTVQAANDTNQKEDREKLALEVAQLLTEIDSISSRTEFNEKKLNDGSFQNGHFQIGANVGQKLEINIGNMSVFGMGMNDIMDTFGLDKKVTLESKSSQEGVVAAGKVSEVGGAIAALTGTNGKTLVSGDVTLAVKNGLTGQTENIKFNLDLKGVAADANAATSATALAKALNANEEFSNTFIASDDGAGNLKVKCKNEGGDYEFTGITVDNIKDEDGTAVTGGAFTIDNASKVNGNYGTIGKDIQDGETVTIANKTFTKVSANEVTTDREFADIDQLITLLKSDGVVASKDAAGNLVLNAVDHNASILAGNYTVTGRNVSDKGKEYSKMLEVVDKSLKQTTQQRAELGANQNRLEYTNNNLIISSENLSAAKSRIEDTDMAKEMMNLTSANVLQQAAVAMLA